MAHVLFFDNVSTSLLIFGSVLLAGIIGAQLTKWISFVPQVCGYILVGILLGADGLAIFPSAMSSAGHVFVDICFGLILFELGKNFNFGWRRQDPWIIFAGISSCVLSFVLMLFSLRMFSFKLTNAIVIATIGITTSPAIVFLIARDLHIDNPVVRRVKGLVAMNNVIGLLVFSAILPYLNFRYKMGLESIWIEPLYFLFGSMLLSTAAYILTLIFSFIVGKNNSFQFIILVAIISFIIGISYALNLSILISLLFYGALIKNFNFKNLILNIEFGYIEDLFFMMLLVVTGSYLSWSGINDYIIPIVVMLFARFCGQFIPVYYCSFKSGFTKQHAALIGAALTPMAATALWISKTTVNLYPEFGSEVMKIILISLLIMQIVGPIVTQWAFKLSDRQPLRH